MEKLLYSPPDIRLPDNRALLRRVSWLHDAPDELLQALLAGKLGGEVTELNLVAKQTAVAQGSLLDAVYVLKRGTILVLHQTSHGGERMARPAGSQAGPSAPAPALSSSQ